MLRKSVATFALACCALACAASSRESVKSTTTPSGTGAGASGAEEHPAEWYTIGNARTDFQTRAREFDLAAADCQVACKALASLERAANHLCAVSEPEECTDARSRVDRARRAISQQCGGC